jgi:hypothetical protein
MATTGMAAEASSQSKRRTLDTIPGRVSAGVSLDSTIGNDGPAAGVGPHGRTGIVGWLRIMAYSRTATAGRSRGFNSGSRTVQHSRPHWRHQTDERRYNQATKQTSP